MTKCKVGVAVFVYQRCPCWWSRQLDSSQPGRQVLTTAWREICGGGDSVSGSQRGVDGLGGCFRCQKSRWARLLRAACMAINYNIIDLCRLYFSLSPLAVELYCSVLSVRALSEPLFFNLIIYEFLFFYCMRKMDVWDENVWMCHLCESRGHCVRICSPASALLPISTSVWLHYMTEI